jgi:GT2 family glycosyltransferase
VPAEPAPRATVVIVNWNGERLLRSCLDALTRQQTSAPFETWVVDNASTDSSVDLLRTEYPQVRVLQNDANLGFAGGNNTALREITTPYAVLLNNDATPEPDWLEQLLAPFEEPGAERLAAVTSKVLFAPRFLPVTLTTEGISPGPRDPRDLGVQLFRVDVDGQDVTERVLMEKATWGPEGEGPGRFRWTRPVADLLIPLPDGVPGPVELSFRWAAEREKPVTAAWDGGSAALPATTTVEDVTVEVPATAKPVDVVNNVGSIVVTSGYGADRGYQDVDHGQYDEAQEVFALCGCAVAFRTEAGQEVDWFDDRFFLYYEDTDLSWRLRAAGWRIRYEPKAVVRHIHSATSVEWSPTFIFYSTRNRLLMLTKDASAARVRREWLGFLRETVNMLRFVVGALRRGKRPPLRRLRMQLRVLFSLLRLTPFALRARRRIARSAQVPRRELEGWLVAPR